VLGNVDQMILTDQMRPQFRKLPFAELGKASKKFFGSHKAQNGIPEELQLLVVRDALSGSRPKHF
jgi:hypothetical protein